MSDMNDFNSQIIAEFRSNAGVVGGNFAGMPLVLLTTTGAKSGLPRINPLACQLAEDGTIYVFASKAGATTDPDWYRNLVANPAVHVEHGTESFDAVAESVTGAARDEIYARQAAGFPTFAEYEKTANRVIPVVALRRA